LISLDKTVEQVATLVKQLIISCFLSYSDIFLGGSCKHEQLRRCWCPWAAVLLLPAVVQSVV